MQLTVAALFGLAVVAFASASVQGFTGFGFGLVGMAFCVPVLGPRDANVLWTLLAALLVATMWWRLRRRTHWRPVLCLFGGSLVGLPAGLWVLAHGGERFLSRFIGAALIVFASFSLVNPSFSRRHVSAAWGLPAGVLAGFFSGLTAMGGPSAVVFLLLSGDDKEGLKADLAAYFTLNIVAKVALLGGASALLTMNHVLWAGALALPLLAGMSAGMYGARFVSADTMRRAVCLLLLVPGALLLLG